MSYAERLRDNLPRLRDRIRRAETDGGRPADSVRLVAVTKAHPPEAVSAALGSGLRHLGENRVEELETKVRAFSGEDVCWHLVGHVQSRKAAGAARLADVVHSVDSLKLARRLNVQAAREGKRLTMMIQVNVSGEASKSGFPLSGAGEVTLEVAELENLQVAGFMTMAPLDADVGVLSRTFGGLRRLSEEVRSVSPLVGAELSMGMTQDLEVAIREGSTMVRIGTALFGPRPSVVRPFPVTGGAGGGQRLD